MIQTVKFKRTLVLLFIGALSVTTSCSSDSKDEASESSLIVGKWWNYKRVYNGVTEVSKSCGEDFSCLTYEFQTNACIINEEGYIDNYSYKIDGDFIKFYDPKTEVLDETNKFSLTKDELILYRIDNTTSTYERHFKRK
jgi:hypothetical protein